MSQHRQSKPVRVDSLRCRRSDRTLFDGLSWSAEAGGLVLVRGPNGSGKTTLLRSLAGFHHPESGTISGVDRPGWIGHTDGLKAELTPAENLEFHRALFGSGANEPATALARAGVGAVADRSCGTLSAGQRRRVALARLLVSYHAVWLLDEPTTALDAEGESLVDNLVDAHCAAGGIAIVATHRAPSSNARVTEVTLG